MIDRRTLAGLLMAAPLAGPTPSRAGTPPGMIVMAGVIDDLTSLDPAESYEFTGIQILANCYRRLVRANPADTATLVPDLASSWTVSPDGRVFTFTLGTDARFPSGASVTADDVVFSLRRVVALNKPPAFIISQFGFTPETVDRQIRADGPSRVIIELPAPVAPDFLLCCLGGTVGSVVERASAMANAVNGDFGNAWLKTRTTGAGAYRVAAWSGPDRLILDPNPHAKPSDGPQAQPRRIVILHVADPAVQLLMLRQGDVDIARDLTPDQLRALESDPEFSIVSVAQGRMMYLAMNADFAPFRHIEVRQAVKWAIDYTGIARHITPRTWDVWQNFLPLGMLGAQDSQPFRRDIARAKALLAAAGFPAGFDLEIDHRATAPYTDIAQALQANLALIGIRVILNSQEHKQVNSRVRARRHQAALLTWATDYFDPHSNAQAWCANPDDTPASKLQILAWRSHFKDDELTALVEAARTELDPRRRAALYHTMQAAAHDRAPFAWMLQNISTVVMRRGVSGYAIGPMVELTDFARIIKA